MLSLMEPIQIDNLVVYRDDDDPSRFYVMPDQPQIPLDEEGVPEFLFIKYIKDVQETADGESLGGGYLQFRTSLALSDARQQKVLAALRDQLANEQQSGKRPFGKAIVSTEPTLASPLWVSGEVALITADEKSGLTTHVFNSTLPDLGSDLGASFAMDLSTTGAEIFWTAFTDAEKQLPLMVSYKLTYKAGVSASMSISAEQSKVHEKLWEAARPYTFRPAPFPRWVPYADPGPFSRDRFLQLQASIPGLMPMLTEERLHDAVSSTIKVNIASDLGSGPQADEIRQMLTKIATDVLTEKLVPALFGKDKGDQTALGANSEDSKDAKVKLRQLPFEPSTDTTSFSVEINQSTTVERNANPNGSLRLLIPEDQQSLNRSCFRELRLSDQFFSTMRVRARPVGVDFDRDGIGAIHVRMRYDQVDDKDPGRQRVQRTYDKALRGKDDVTDWRFDLARRAAGGHKRQYEFQTEVHYLESIPATATAWMPSTDRELLLNAQALGALRVELVYTARKDFLDGARVSLRHISRSGTTYETAMDLSPEAPKKNWFQFTGDLLPRDGTGDQPEYEAQISYRTVGGEVALPAQVTTQKTLEIASPFKRVIRYTVVPQGFTEGVTNISGDLIYEDPRYQYKIVKSFVLDKPSASAGIDVPLLDGGPAEARLEARVNSSNGAVKQLAPIKAREGTTLIGAVTTDFLEVQVLPLPDLDFDKDVQMIVVEISYDDSQHRIPPAVLTFSKGNVKPQTWKVPLENAQNRRYSYSIRFIAYDRSKSTELKKSGAEDPMILLDRQASLPPPPAPGGTATPGHG